MLAEHWPGAAWLFQKLTSKITLAFLTDYPTPQAAAHLGERRMGQFCRRHAYRGGKSPAELIKRLRAAPAAATRRWCEVSATCRWCWAHGRAAAGVGRACEWLKDDDRRRQLRQTEGIQMDDEHEGP